MTVFRAGTRSFSYLPVLVAALGMLVAAGGTAASLGSDQTLTMSRPSLDRGFLLEETSSTLERTVAETSSQLEPELNAGWPASVATSESGETGRSERQVTGAVELKVETGAGPAAVQVAVVSLDAVAAEPAGFERIQLIGAETWDDGSRRNVEQALAILPAGVRSKLGNPDLGDLLILVNGSGATSSGRQPYGGPANFYSTNEGLNEVVLYPGQPVLTVLHELGHAYSLRHSPAGDYASMLLGEEMASFLAAAGWTLRTPASDLMKMRDHGQVAFEYDGEQIWQELSREDPLEDFANSFALYFSDPGALAGLSPARYAWFSARF